MRQEPRQDQRQTPIPGQPEELPESNPTAARNDGTGNIRYTDLPEIVYALSSDHLQKAKDLLEELEMLNVQIQILTARWDEIREELTGIQQENNLPGLRYGRLAFAAIRMPGRRTLDRTKLIEAGVTIEQLEAGTRQGEEYWARNFKVINAQGRRPRS